MSLRRALVAVAIAVSASWATLAGEPSVVLISLDTYRADRLAPWGGSKELAPNLNALAAKGSVFTNCFPSAPETLPSHATLLTGASPDVTGLQTNGLGTLAAGVPTLAGALAEKGFSTGAVVADAVLHKRYGLSRGFIRYDDLASGGQPRTAEQVTDLALAFLKAQSGRRFFLWAHYFDTHFPYDAPEAYAHRTSGGPYEAAAAYVDAQVGRLLKALPPDTLVVVVSDHGEALGEHGELTHGVYLFQPTVRVVCMLAGPGVPAGKASAVPCSLADVAPTVLKLCGLPPSLLKGDGTDLVALAAETAPAPRALPMRTWLPFAMFRWLPLVGVTDGRYKWVRGKADHLYDLSSDPGETKDLASDPPAQAKALRAKLPPLPTQAPAGDSVDPALLGLGYAPAPGGHVDVSRMPDPYDMGWSIKDVAQARLDRKMGQLDKALQLFRSVTERDPGNPYACFEYGETLRQAGKPQEAIKVLDRTLAISPAMSGAWAAKGLAFVALEKPADGAKCFERALLLEPDFTLALDPLAAHYLDLDEPDKANALLERAVSTGIADSRTYLLRGRVRLVQKRSAEAAKDFEAALRLSQHPEQTMKEEADAYLVCNYFDEGVRLYSEGIRLYPRYSPNYLTLGSTYLQMEKPQEALALFRKALSCELDAQTREQVKGIVKDLEAALASPQVEP